MTLTGNNGGPACREIRHLLGVYVLGAIEPAERAVTDEHLMHCQSCRDELAGLAGLPAMLSRVPVADVERLSHVWSELPADIQPTGGLLNALLGSVAARRRSRLWRGAIAVAAAVAVAAGAATAAVELARPATAATEVASATSSSSGVAAVVDYTASPWGGTTMRVQVNGIPPGTTCQFWVVGKHGRAFAGQWKVHGSYGQAWYSASSTAAPGSVQSFQLTSGGKVLVTIPAS